MWKSTDPKAPSTPGSSPSPQSVPSGTGTTSAAPKPVTMAPRPVEIQSEIAHIGKSVVIKGELSGSEDLYLDGEVEGSVELKQHSLTIGPHGKVRANLHAREVILHGKVDGNVQADDRVELKKSAILVGDVSTQRIVIEDGAFFKGSIDIQKESGSGRAMGAAAGAGSSSRFDS